MPAPSSRWPLPPTPRPDTLLRPALQEHLDRGMARRLTTLTAPGGYGKTTLLAQWAATSPGRVVWVMLQDDTAPRDALLPSLVAALERSAPEITATTQALLSQPSGARGEVLIDHLADALAGVLCEWAVVIDDVHAVIGTSDQAHLVALIDRAPPNVHFYLSGRSQPPLRLERRRSRRDALLLTARHLRFDSAEIGALLQLRLGRPPSPELLSQAQEWSEGWAAGLQLIILAGEPLRRRHPTSPLEPSLDPEACFGYLAEEVLGQQPPHVVEFLESTALLGELHPALCDAVTQREDSAELLARLEERGLFTWSAGGGASYRYHALLRAFCRVRLSGRSQEERRALHARAARWFHAEGDLTEAVHHGLAAGERPWVASILEAQVHTLWTLEQMRQLEGWLGELGEELLAQRPRLLIYHAWTWIMVGRMSAVEARLDQARQRLQQAPERYAPLRGELATVEATLKVQQRSMAALDCYRRAERELPSSAHNWRGAVHLGMGMASLEIARDPQEGALWLGRAMETGQAAGNPFLVHYAAFYQVQAYLLSADLEGAEAAVERSRAALGAHHQALISAWSRLGEAALRLERGQAGQAIETLIAAIELGRRHQDREIVVRGELDLARAQLDLSPDAPVGALVEDARAWAARMGIPDLSDLLRQSRWELALLAGDVHAALTWAQEQGLIEGDRPELPWGARLLAIRTLLEVDRPAQVRARCLALRAAEPPAPRGVALRLDTLEAAALCQGGFEEQALAALARAPLPAAMRGHRRPLEEVRHHLSGAALAALASLPPLERGRSTSPGHTPERALVEPLTSGERALLRLVARGLRNEEIATQKALSINTVKWHLKSAYAKLGARSRTAAVARARSLGLI